MARRSSINDKFLNLKRRMRKILRRRDAPSILLHDYLHLYTLASGMRRFLAGRDGRVLDLGCGDSPYRSFVSENSTYIRLDMMADCAPDIIADAVKLPFRAESFDLIISSQVGEFVPNPDILVAECHRVLKPGGTIVFSVPFFWQNQPFEADNYRFTISSMHRLFSAFTDVEIRPNGNKWQTLLQTAMSCVSTSAGIVGMPIFLVGNAFGRLLGALPPDSIFTTGYTVCAVKSIHG